MSVVECDRAGCENILCTRMSDTYGYLCEECLEALVAKGPDADITEFMRSQAPGYFRREDAKAVYEKEFKDFGFNAKPKSWSKV